VKANTKHLLKRYAIDPLGCAYLIFVVTGLLRRGEYTPVIAFAVLIAIVVPLLVSWVPRKALAFKYPTPDRAIALYHRFESRAPHSKALLAFNSAFAAALYGEFDRAREELASINWSTLPPLYQGPLRENTFQDGESWARESALWSHVSKNWQIVISASDREEPEDIPEDVTNTSPSGSAPSGRI
jgi:hypothetical protein